MERVNLVKLVGGVLAAAVVLVGGWLVWTGKIGPMKDAEQRAASERIQREVQGAQWRQNLQSPFRAVGIP